MTDGPVQGAALRVMDSQGLGRGIRASLLYRKGQMRGAQADGRRLVSMALVAVFPMSTWSAVILTERPRLVLGRSGSIG